MSEYRNPYTFLKSIKNTEKTEEQKIESSFKIISSSFLRAVNEEINKPHPTLKSDDLNMDKIRHDIFNTTNEVTEQLKKFKYQKKQLEESLQKQQSERQRAFAQKGIRGKDFEIPPETIEQLERISAHIAECARFIAGTILHTFGLAPPPGPYRPSLTPDQMKELEIQQSQDALMQIISADGSVRDNVERAIVECHESKKQRIAEWENRPEAKEAQERLNKFSVIMSGDMADSFKQKICGMKCDEVFELLDKIDVQDGKILAKSKSPSLNM
ncbi:hypothetical protein [Acetobacter pasteurianus]|uniref:hypothetical protein n=1 Tax=Acetobacter pasteurianus TaxID=438 RepID=UPI000F564ABE|nr:hypothetical protein [Acetobacter pasteurianus]GCD54879.1 hypothetical protein NBRC3222_0216 [Acetobacter pasteurianus NBRC 3222]